MVGSNLELTKKYLVNKNVDCAFFNTRTNSVVNSAQQNSVEGDWQLLFDMANSGERLVVVKKTQYKPFFGILRGHELAGLFRFAERDNYKLC